MSTPFNVNAWYWAPAGHGANVFSSAAPGYVSNTDTTYLAWIAAGNTANAAITDGEMVVMFNGLGMDAAALAVNPGDLSQVSRPQAAAAALGAGVALTSTGTPALDATYETSGLSFDAMRFEWEYANEYAAFDNGVSPLVWPARSGNVNFTTVAQLQAVMRGILDYTFSWRRWSSVGGSPPAWGTITIA